MRCCGGGGNLGKHEWNCPLVKRLGYAPPNWRKPFMWRLRHLVVGSGWAVGAVRLRTGANAAVSTTTTEAKE